MKIKVNQVDYYVKVSGRGQPTWLLLHGFMGSQQDFATVAAHLPGTIISVDLLGHGQSTPVDAPECYTMPVQAEDLRQLLLQLSITQPINLVGYSMGGRLALYFALQYPQMLAHLFLESCTAGIADPKERAQRRAHDQQQAQQLLQAPLVEFVDAWEQLPLFKSQRNLDPAIQQQIRQQRLAQDPRALAASLLGMGTGSMPNLWPRLANLAIPTTLITGAKDPKFHNLAQKMASLLPNNQWKEVPTAGHNVHAEQPTAYVRILRESI
ncbi:2-succinyl-6-hydroxy-2,4-cyclohexadiene-1-carboxylate synthase [Bombilactobacillus thymidiniphilus]|uniref:Putative 2-succinyl-6-hydroxy-2,4-cyclohexadiene-1-carboxylate synthase n=1 Tax=Bombilactobacillus thymidiniphilus TaxID=2923363 RepID=A0ABY4PEC2_9LACO|nr:2-succinyl-6-hydroxy-2,4-cyclohexadiene-1-carboxylate synthase [Bombilactobacillus thymidiniphilus]UQS84138.1 2-succinyl-6-hydroxy-2,4-cyclohexadiene-1-carboxylate synthase [Bombilactobacillus thymidiniphilus]